LKTFSTSCVIHAAPTKVWSVLTDLAAWPSWNTTVPKVEGTVALGNKVTVYTTASPGRAFPVKVAALNPPREMLWIGGMPLGLFVGQRTYTLTEHSPGKTTFSMKEEFSGLLAPLIAKSIPDLQPLFVEFAACLKRASESA
jgi:hypothetical protein